MPRSTPPAPPPRWPIPGLALLSPPVPLLLVPLGADHFANTAAAVRRGAALALEEELDASSIEAALRRLLTDQSIRRAAADIAAEIAAMPSPAAAAEGILAWLGERTTVRPSGAR